MGPEKTCYYWEPMGSALPSRDAIRRAFETAAPAGWALECLPLSMQADGHSCGDWAHYFRSRVLEYVAAGLCGSRTFPDFLRDELTNLRSVRGRPRAAAEVANNAFATRRRDALRELLRAAASQGRLPWGECRLADFGAAGSTDAVFIDLDEELEGDNMYHPIFIPE
jgi:hypothetical protein